MNPANNSLFNNLPELQRQPGPFGANPRSTPNMPSAVPQQVQGSLPIREPKNKNAAAEIINAQKNQSASSTVAPPAAPLSFANIGFGSPAPAAVPPHAPVQHHIPQQQQQYHQPQSASLRETKNNDMSNQLKGGLNPPVVVAQQNTPPVYNKPITSSSTPTPVPYTTSTVSPTFTPTHAPVYHPISQPRQQYNQPQSASLRETKNNDMSNQLKGGLNPPIVVAQQNTPPVYNKPISNSPASVVHQTPYPSSTPAVAYLHPQTYLPASPPPSYVTVQNNTHHHQQAQTAVYGARTVTSNPSNTNIFNIYCFALTILPTVWFIIAVTTPPLAFTAAMIIFPIEALLAIAAIAQCSMCCC